MAGMLGVPIKLSDNVDYAAALKNFISENYDVPPASYNNALLELNKLKSAATHADQAHASSIGHLLRYYSQCLKVAEKFPMENESQIRVSFNWSDSVKGGKKAGCRDIQYEAACVMFNVGAVYSNIGAQTALTDEGCKTACTAFQNAAGAFSYVRDVCHSKFSTAPQTDMTVDCLNVLVNVMLAEAQECFFRKAQLGKMKNQILAKLAAQAADYYADACTAMDCKVLKGYFTKQWVGTITAKRDMFLAAAHYKQSQALQDAQEFGPALAYLQKAEELAKSASKNARSAGLTELLVSPDVVSAELKALHKDNDTIYHEVIPKDDSLEPLPRAPMVKALTPNLDAGGADDLLACIVPIAIRRSHARYVDEVERLIRNECEGLDKQLAEGSRLLSELGMPAALDAVERPIGVPPALIEKSKQARERGGVSGLRDKMDNVRTVGEQNQAVLDESLRILNEEEQQDDQMRSKYPADWSRTPSSKLTKELRDEAKNMQAKLDAARRADGLVRQKFEDSYNIMDSLCRTDDLASILPQGAPPALSAKMKEVSAAIRELIAKYEQARQEVPGIKDRLQRQKAKDDIISKLVAASTTAEDENKLINEQLKGMFGEAQTEAAANIKMQKQLLEEIKKRATEYQSYGSSNDVTRKRETVLNNLGVAHDKFEELQSNLKEGTQFYTDMLNRLLKFQTKCTDYAQARKAEALELERRIQTRPAPVPAPQPSSQAPPGHPPSHMPPPGSVPPPGPPPGHPPAGYWQPGMPVQYAPYGAPPPGAYAPGYPPSPYGAQPYAPPPPGAYAPYPGYAPQPGQYPPPLPGQYPPQQQSPYR